mgnify:CR=1 FL=1
MRCSTDCLLTDERGQSTVEAAFALPLFFALFALLLQPAVLLYDRCVMQSAAAETCRLVALDSCSAEAAQAFALRRLEVLPRLDLFHTSACAWEIQLGAGEGSGSASVRIEGHVKTMPLLGITASSMTEAAGDGCALMRCKLASTLRPAWLGDGAGSPSEWIGQWE